MALELRDVEKSFKENEGFWVDYDEDVKIKVRPLYPEKINQLRKRAIGISKQGIKEVDEKKYSKLVRDYLIVDWKGITIDGSDECTEEGRKIIDEYHQDLILFIVAKAKELAKIISNQNEEQLKNLTSLLGQS